MSELRVLQALSTDHVHIDNREASVNDSTTQGRDAWQAVHEALLRLAKSRAALDLEEGPWLCAAKQANVDARLGFGSFVEYIERLFGYTPRLTLEKLRVAQALENLPECAQALRDGAVTWSGLRELTRVATPQTERGWLERARGRTVREVEKLVSGHEPGDLPDDPADAALVRHILRFEVSAVVMATFREAMIALKREAGGPLDDDAALLLMARRVLGGPSDEGRASYQVEVAVCDECGRGAQIAAGESVRLEPEVVDMASCDAQHVSSGRRASQEIPPATRRAVLRRDRHRCRAPGCRHTSFVDVHHVRARQDGGGHEEGNLLTMCGAHHRAVHLGQLLITGSEPDGLRFWHADGSEYGQMPSSAQATAQARAFRALRGLGFGERDVRRALEQTHVGGDSVEAIVREALRSLTEGAIARAS
jgi:5-methylcytosine-specific restriction endonuclease McrA